ncbi:MAG: oligoendopeptidase F [Candidatus Marinimicrobia bacterium]|jgi:oligoendopeptidase F|nr:oligoendopeptidase F [Candidatus Neomarinimicrobiota bacterium]
MRTKLFVALIALTFVLGLTSCQSKKEESVSKEVPTRSDIETQYKWNLQDIYSSADEWESDFEYVKSHISDIEQFKGTLRKSGKNIVNCFKAQEKLERKLDQLQIFAYLQKDEDTRISENLALTDRISSLYSQYAQKASFVAPELRNIPEAKLNKFISSTKELNIYEHYFDDFLRQKQYILSTREEELLAMAGNVFRNFSRIREALTTADIQFPMVKDDKGNEIELSYSRYRKLLLSKDPKIRKGAFEGMYSTYEKFNNTSAATYDGSVKKDMFYSKARGYNSSLGMSLSNDNIPVEVYDNLIETTHKYLKPLQHYMELRKKVLGIDSLHLYDTSVPIVEDSDKKYPFDEARELVLSALKPLGKEYVKDAKKALNSRWIDVYETKGKRSGAYSWGAYDTHPYMLLNYNDTRDNIFTLAHELGHSMHSFYTNETQPYVYANYSMFVAEVASTFNENLLMHYLLNNTEDEQERLVLLDKWADNIQGTLYTQVLFAEFEKKSHEMAEQGIPLTAKSLNNAYMNILDEFYGDVLTLDEKYKVTWSRIPHFYRAFYVYVYATSISASTALSQKVLADKPNVLENYLNMLHSGSSSYPIELLKGAGVDMSKPDAIENTLKLFDKIVTEMDEIISKKQ